jgi:hypothetical protein
MFWELENIFGKYLTEGDDDSEIKRPESFEFWAKYREFFSERRGLKYWDVVRERDFFDRRHSNLCATPGGSVRLSEDCPDGNTWGFNESLESWNGEIGSSEKEDLHACR